MTGFARAGVARSRWVRALGASWLVAVLAACVHEREKRLPWFDGPLLAVARSDSSGGASGDGSPFVASRESPVSSDSRDAPRESRVPAPPAVSPPERAEPPTYSRRSSTPRSAAGAGDASTSDPPPPAHRPLAPGVTLEQVAREKFLSAPTTIDADQATVYVPAGYAGEISLTGASVSEETAGRRVVTGGGVLVLRRLTVRAARLTIVSRPAGEEDFQVTARGGVSFTTSQPSGALVERDLKSLLVRNDGYTPLR